MTLIKVLDRVFPPDSRKLYLIGIPYQIETITATVIGGTAFTGGRGRIAGITLCAILIVYCNAREYIQSIRY